MKRRPALTVEIERLVVDAATGLDGRLLARAIEAELARLEAGAGEPPGAGGGRLEVAERRLRVPADAAHREIATRVAEAIWQAGRQTAHEEES